MSLKEKIKGQIVTATKLRRDSAKNVLKVVLGEINTQENRASGKLGIDDNEVCKIIKKTLQGIEEMLGYKPGDVGLEQEKEALVALLPKQLDFSGILSELASQVDEIKAAKSDGQATGIAMKHLKGKMVDGKDVAEVVKNIRKI